MKFVYCLILIAALSLIASASSRITAKKTKGDNYSAQFTISTAKGKTKEKISHKLDLQNLQKGQNGEDTQDKIGVRFGILKDVPALLKKVFYLDGTSSFLPLRNIGGDFIIIENIRKSCTLGIFACKNNLTYYLQSTYLYNKINYNIEWKFPENSIDKKKVQAISDAIGKAREDNAKGIDASKKVALNNADVLTSAEESLKAANSDVSVVDSQIEELNGKISTLTEENKDITDSKIPEAAKQIKEIEVQLANLKQLSKDLNNKRSVNEEAINTHKSNIKSLEDSKTNKEEVVSNLSSTKSSASSTLEEELEKIQTLGGVTVKKNVDAAKQGVTDLNKEVIVSNVNAITETY